VQQTGRFYFLMFLFLIVVLGYLTYQIMSPFLNAIIWGVVLSIVFYPIYAFLSRYLKAKAFSSFLTVVLILGIILGPFTYLTFTLLNELQVVTAHLNEKRLESVQELIHRFHSSRIFHEIVSYMGIEDMVSEDVIMENITNVAKGLIAELPLRISNVLSAALNFIFMIFTAFVLFRDGPVVLSKVKDYMPFKDHQKERLATQIKDIVVSTVYGGVLVAVIQGTLGGIAYFFLGIGSPVLWGLAMSVMSFVPILGTFIIWGPTTAYLVVQGNYMKGAGLLLFGVLVISMVDNVLKPLIIGSRTKMPTIIILFSVLGGIKLFGILGLVLGPLVTAIFISVFDIFRSVEGE
jgi:predicted PurR-regulated permease PerM